MCEYILDLMFLILDMLILGILVCSDIPRALPVCTSDSLSLTHTHKLSLSLSL